MEGMGLRLGKFIQRWLVCVLLQSLSDLASSFLVRGGVQNVMWDHQNLGQFRFAKARSVFRREDQRARGANIQERMSISDQPRTEKGKFLELVRQKAWLERAKRWVIIVDDEEAIRLAVGDYLFDQGYQVTACADADALFDVLTSSNTTDDCKQPDVPNIPDIIVSDIRMPGKDGLELLSFIRSNPRLARVPVVLLTAKSLAGDRIAGYKAGADAYLPKPFSPEELLSIIDNAILRREQMTGKNGKLVDLRNEMSDVIRILKRNGDDVVQATDVYLTPTERKVLELLCEGYTNGEIAKERKVSPVGVNRTVQTLYLKTQTKTRTELVRWAIKTGQIERS